MKVLSILSTFIFAVGLNSQIYEVTEGSHKFEGKQRDAIHVTLDPDGKETSRALRSYFKSEHNVKLSWFGWKNRDAEEASLSAVSSEKLNLYFHFNDMNKQSEIFISMSYGEEKFLTFANNPMEFKNMDSLMNDFLKEFLADHLNEKIDDLNSEIGKLDKSLSKARKNLNKNEKKFDKNEKRIKKLSKENEELKEENADLKETINEKEKKIESKSENLMKERKSLESTIESLRRN